MKELYHRLRLVYQHSGKPSLAALFVSIPNFQSMDDKTLLAKLEETYLPDAIVCPVCKHVMKDHSWASSGYDSDNEWNTWGETIYSCHHCHTQKIEDEWKIPESYQASDKQLRCAKRIAFITKKPLPPPTKQLIWQYIHDNINQTKQIQDERQENDMGQYCEDCPDYIPSYEELC